MFHIKGVDESDAAAKSYEEYIKKLKTPPP
jgi:hypothetical protein